MAPVLTISGDPLRSIQREQTAAAATSAPVAAVPVDEFGRELIRSREPIIGEGFQPRVRDRRSNILPPWSIDQIASALRAAENGDMSQQSELMEHMEDTDGELLSYMQTRRLAQCGLTWSIIPANDSKEAEEIAQMVRTEIEGIPNFEIGFRNMQDAIGKSLSALWLDWRPGGRHEASRYRIEGFNHISPKRYRFHWAKEQFLILPDEVPGGTQAPGTAGLSTIGVEPLPWKVLVHKTQIKSGHPAKAGVLRLCAVYWYLRRLSLKDFAVFCDIFGLPGRIFQYPESATDEEKAQLAVAAEKYGTDFIAIVSQAVEVKLLETKAQGQGTSPYDNLHTLCGRQMQMGICGQDQTNTHNAAGGRTQVAEGGAKIRQDLLEADCIDTQSTLKAQLCYPIVGFSKYERPTVIDGQLRWPVADALTPKFKIHYEPPKDRESMIAVDVPLYTVLRVPVTIGYIAKRYETPLPEGVDPNALLTPATVGQPSPDEGDDGDETTKPDEKAKKKGRGKKSFAARLTAELTERILLSSTSPTRAQEDIDDLGDRGTEASSAALAPLIAPIRTLLQEIADRRDLTDEQRFAIALQRLPSVFEEMDASEVEKLIRRGLFVARLFGQATAIRKKDS